uniref:Uncharacterized protein n=1 Tax=Oryza rufipogon TaxID=4529 RepID=A0A0E0N9R6_ORYRU
MEETRRQRRRRKRECECQPRDGATATLRSPRRRRSPLRWPTSHRILSPPPSPSSPSWRSPSYPPSPRTPRLMPFIFRNARSIVAASSPAARQLSTHLGLV